MSTIKITDIDEVWAGDLVTVETVANDWQAGGGEFTRWLAERDREVAAKALSGALFPSERSRTRAYAALKAAREVQA